MGYFFVISALLLSFTLSKSLADVSSLQDQNQAYLDPLQDQDQDLSINNQDKRTICALFNKCGSSESAPTSSYVKRLVIKGGLKQQFVGYAPLIKPVGVRPVVLGGYRYPKPKIHLRLKAPSAIQGGGWKPVQTASKPVVEVVKPVNHVDFIHNNPVPHVDHVVPGHHHTVARPDHVHLQPVQPTFVHLRPVAAGGAHVDQVHQINVPHGNHYDTFTHIDHLQLAAVPVAQQVVPLAPPPTVVKPFVPSPVLFEVTKPNLGVLPLGAKFLTPILKQAPHVHFGHVAPVAPAVAPTVVHQHPVPAVQGIIHTPVGLPPIVPHPGVSVEYHGTRNYLPLAGTVPFVHQTAVGALQPLPHQGISVHQHLPFEHASHGFAPQQALPLEHAAHGFAVQQQALPHEHQTQFVHSEQQLPHFHPQLPHLEQQLQAIQQYQDIPQGQLPLEGEQQYNFNQFLQEPNALNMQNFDQSNVIQPGQTDLQIPYHLPQHDAWNAVQQEESRGFGNQVFRPSPQLEPPYKK